MRRAVDLVEVDGLLCGKVVEADLARRVDGQLVGGRIGIGDIDDRAAASAASRDVDEQVARCVKLQRLPLPARPLPPNQVRAIKIGVS
jgi:hypothetical protein